MAEPIRILHVLGNLNLGGAESRIMDLYRNIDKSRVQFDFVIHTTKECYFTKEITSMGGRIYSVPCFKIYNYISYAKAWKKFMEEHAADYKMIQGHMTSTASIYLPIAKKSGITTIAHARSAGVDSGIKGKVTRFMRRNLSQKADFLFTCSELAGISVFGKKATEEGKTIFIPNAIEIDKFRFNPKTREDVRKELEIEDRFVIGHVGRFHYAKNHEFLLNVFKEVINKYDSKDDKDGKNVKDTVVDKKPLLLMLGEGPRMAEMKTLSKELGIEEDVIFAGNHSDVYRYYQGMDLFLYPSRYEGLPGTVVEAQASGLKTIMSDLICDEVIFTDLIDMMSIEKSPAEWADKVVDFIKEDKGLINRISYNDISLKSDFNVKSQAEIMSHFYEKGELNDNH